MIAIDGKSDVQPGRRAALLERKPRHENRKRMRPTVEGLESIALMAVTPVGPCTISGYVFFDGSQGGPAPSDNGLFDPGAGEYGLAGAVVQLKDSQGNIIATTTTQQAANPNIPNNPNDTNLGFYQFNLANNGTGQSQQITQTLTIPSTLTNFSNQSLLPTLQLFNPSLGQLVDVKVTGAGSITTNITAQNLSRTSAATNIMITPSGNITLNNVSPAVPSLSMNVPTTPITEPDLPVGSATTYGPFTTSLPSTGQPFVYNDAATLAEYTSGGGGVKAVTPTFTGTGGTIVTAQNGNLNAVVNTAATATVTVTYDYVPSAPCLAPGNYTLVQTPIFLGNPATLVNGKSSDTNGTVYPTPGPGQPQSIPITITAANDTNFNLMNNDFAKVSTPLAQCAPITSVKRVGFHHQSPQFLVKYGPGPIDLTQVTNPANYTILSPGKDQQFNDPDDYFVPVTSVSYNPTTRTATVTAGAPINLHDRVLFTAKLPCYGQNPFVTIVGGKRSILGFPHPFKSGVLSAHGKHH